MAGLHLVQNSFWQGSHQRKVSQNLAKSFMHEDTGRSPRDLILKKNGRSLKLTRDAADGHDHAVQMQSYDLSNSGGRDARTRRVSNDVSKLVVHELRSRKISSRAYSHEPVLRPLRVSDIHPHEPNHLESRRPSMSYDHATETSARHRRESRDEVFGPRAHTFVGKRTSRGDKLGTRHKTSFGTFRDRRSTGWQGGQGNPKAKEKFRHSVRLILILLRWVAEITKTSAKHNKFLDQLTTTFSELAQEAYNSEELRNGDLAFDASYFKANKDINLTAEVKDVLRMPPAARTKEQLQAVLFGLQHLRSFAEYPLHMQEKLCRVAWYERVPPRRVIIRQGHTAENFYFILSGKAIVKRAETNPVTGETIIRTAAVMTKGMSFGELALLHHSRRTATVVTQDTTQLLTIGRRDFMDIFMGGTVAGHVPDHIKFVTTLEFMKDWPVENLMQHPEFCLFHFFKRGVVMVPDSVNSDWLYIVKSGACQVMKELKAATTSPTSKKSKKIDLAISLPKLGTGEQSPRIDDGRKRGGLPQVPTEIKTAMTDFAMNAKRLQERVEGQECTSSVSGSPNNLPRISVDDDPESDSKKQKTSVSSVKVLHIFHHTALHNSSRPGFSRSKFVLSSNKRRGNYPPAPSPDIIPESAEKENNSANGTHPSTSSKSENEPEGSSVFVQVQLLKPRDVFGLSSIQFDDDVPVTETSVSLVSRGAECIMLSKQFFMKHANERVRMELRRQVRPYPTADTFQENLQIKVDWDNYRKELLKEITTQHEAQSAARKTAR